MADRGRLFYDSNGKLRQVDPAFTTGSEPAEGDLEPVEFVDIDVSETINTADVTAATEGQALTKGASGTALEFVSVGGGTTFIEELTPTGGADAEFSTNFAAHRGHTFYLHNVIPSTDTEKPFVRTSTDGGLTFDSGATDYRYAASAVSEAAGTANYGSAGANNIILTNSGIGTAGNESGVSGKVELWGSGMAQETHITWQLAFVNQGNDILNVIGSGRRMAQEDVDAIQITFGNGIASGAIQHLGVN